MPPAPAATACQTGSFFTMHTFMSSLHCNHFPIPLTLALLSGKLFDACNVCGGGNSSCMGCDGVLHR